MFYNLYTLYFEGDEVTNQEGTQNAAPAKAPATFTQDDVNKFLADDRRKHEQRYRQLESTHQSLLGSRQLEASEREALEKSLEDLQASFRTKEQQLEYEKKQAALKYSDELQKMQEAAKRWEALYKAESVDRALLDAAGPDAYNKSQIVDLLRPVTSLKEEVGSDGKPTGKLIPMVTFQDVDEKTGEPIKTLRTPLEAVGRMKELVDQYGNLFRSNVVSGVGAGNAPASGGKGQAVDVSRLTPEQYRKIRKENPELLGLRSRNPV